MTIKGKAVLITGASRGIGESAARVFAAAGAHVAVMARSRQAVAQLAHDLGPPAFAITGDVSRFADMQRAVARCVEAFGRLDVVINNAGALMPVAHLATADPQAWQEVVATNLGGVFNGMRAAVPVMIAAGGGTVLTVGSGAAHAPLEAWSHYCASKAGALMLTRCLHLENRAQGIRALSLSPGTVATQMQKEIRASGVNPVSQLDWGSHIPPQWVGHALVWMCGAEADAFLGGEVSLRDAGIRRKLGLG
ncbi:MAG: SDR family oxidoreductase [Rhodobacteraceae bacterium]|nr:SDR family oxidoreductase [Paracoccaceae bacterium]